MRYWRQFQKAVVVMGVIIWELAKCVFEVLIMGKKLERE